MKLWSKALIHSSPQVVLSHLCLPACLPSFRLGLSVNAFLPQVVQLGAGLVQVQVHIHHSSWRALVEICCNLVEGLAPCLWHPEECEDEEEEEECCEDQEDIWPTKISNILEAHANDEVGSPVGAAGHSHGSRSWTLREQLSDKKPGDGARTDFKEGHKTKDGQHADVAHRRNIVQ